MEIFRYECPVTGCGPYQIGNPDLENMGHFHDASKEHPKPEDDFRMWHFWHSSNIFFGFKSLEDLNNWFNGFHEIILKHGFRIAVYEVNSGNVIFSKSGKQLVFRKNKSKFKKLIDN